VLEILSGGDLYQYLDVANKNLNEDAVRNLVKNIADALVYLKRELVIHCDICPRAIYSSDRAFFVRSSPKSPSYV
jgi:serine/threonine protein kinase